MMTITTEEYELLNPQREILHEGVRMVFMTPSRMTKFRVEHIYGKEPCTLEWIETFAPEDVMFDVGANVGMYTIWAAATRGCRVFAFEPEGQNYAVLNRNIFANSLQDRVKAYCLALSDTGGLAGLHIARLQAGWSQHFLDGTADRPDDPLPAAFMQGCVALTLDDLIAMGTIPVPTHLKIDVDGIEHKIIAGAAQLLRRSELRSLLVEVNLNLAEHRALVNQLRSLDFTVDPNQVQLALKESGPFAGYAEHVFRR
ncbi:MAG: FkbM family methyltransferase [Cyanobacteria bacterium]|nr:FkbM family methyltransferase [Cyanobacteriota bacterium]